ncbi:MAG: hypothetical protein RIB86_15365 [Imperialibacter sp.]
MIKGAIEDEAGGKFMVLPIVERYRYNNKTTTTKYKETVKNQNVANTGRLSQQRFEKPKPAHS